MKTCSSMILAILMMLGCGMAQELGVLGMKLEYMRERCLVEKLPTNTVALCKLSVVSRFMLIII